MHLHLVARTRNDINQSATAAAKPSSPPPRRGPEGEQQTRDGEEQEEEDKRPPPPPLLETEKLRAGIQQLLSSAPAPPSQHQQKKRQEATPRRRATPRRAAGAPSATKKTPAPASASASNAAAGSGNSSSSSRPYKAQLALFSVSKPARLPCVADGLRACVDSEGMEDQVRRLNGEYEKKERDSLSGRTNDKKPHDAHASFGPRLLFTQKKTKQAPLAAASAAGASPQCPSSAVTTKAKAKAAAVAAAAAAETTLAAANAAAARAAASPGAPPSPAPAPVAPPPPPPPLDPFAAYRAAVNAMNAARTATATGDGASASASAAAVVRAAAPPQPSQHLLQAAVPPPSPGANAALAAPSPLRLQRQQQQQQAWASPGAQQQNSNARRLPLYPRGAAALPPTPQLPAGSVDDCYREFSRQQEACAWADAVNRLAFAAAEAAAKKREEAEGGEGRGGEGGATTRAPPSTSTSNSTTIDDGRLFDHPSALPDPSLLDVESLPAAPYEPVKVFCMEVPVDNPVVAQAAAASFASPSSSAAQSSSDRPTHYRKFLAASYPAFLRRYLSPIAAATGGRHVYEVLRESRPCHAYFDVEFAKHANPNADGDAMVDALVAAVRAELAALVGESAATAALVLESDSSTAAKFSRHLLLRLPGKLAFRDNAAVGRLLGEALSRDGAAARLRVAKAESSNGGGGSPFQNNHRRAAPAASTWVADTAVYTKNRHFRVLLSSKGGKNADLEPTSRHAHGADAPLDAAETTRRELVLSSLVANVEPGTRLVDVAPGGGGGGRVAIAGVVSGNGCSAGGAAAAAGGGSAGAPRLVSREMTLYRSDGRPIKFEWKHHAADLRQGGGEEGTSGPPPSSSQQPDPRLVEAALAAVPFVEELAVKRAGRTAPGAAKGDAHVRSAAVIGCCAPAATTAGAGGGGGNSQTSLPPLRSAVVAFSLLGPAAHWCEFVGRRHAGNYVYFVLDFGAGTYVQRCYDPDCAAKKSCAMPLQPELMLRVEKE